MVVRDSASVFVAVLALFGAACGDDTSASGSGGGGGSTSATGTTSTATTATGSSSASSPTGAGGQGTGGDGSSFVSVGVGGGGAGQGGGVGVGGGAGQGGGGAGQGGGGSGVCADTCGGGAPPDDACQTCVETAAQSTCQGQAINCFQADAQPGDTKGCLGCIDYALGGFAGMLCESSTDALNTLIECACEACG
jgi:hypothetical protein